MPRHAGGESRKGYTQNNKLKLKYPNLESERYRAGFTREELAFELKVKRDVYTAWVEGVYPIPANFSKKLSTLLNCSVNFLLSPDEGSNERWKNYRCVWRAE